MENNNWITEALVQFTRSPAWLTPINSFMDENCNIFTNDNDIKLEYTVIHQKFKSLIDDLLSEFVGELGVSLEDAVSAVRSSLQSDHELEHKSVESFMKYIYAFDDFESFFRMMIKRNIELDIIAVRALQAKGVDLSASDSENLLSSIDKSAPPTPEDIARIMAANGKCDDEEAFRRAICASLHENPKEQVKRLEEAELKEKEALSAQAQRDRAQFSAGDNQKQVRQPLSKCVKSVVSKEPKAAISHQPQTRCAIASPPEPTLDGDEKPVSSVPVPNQQMTRTEAAVSASEPNTQLPTAANGDANPSPQKKDQSRPLPALTTSKLQQPLGGPKLQPLPPI